MQKYGYPKDYDGVRPVSQMEALGAPFAFSTNCYVFPSPITEDFTPLAEYFRSRAQDSRTGQCDMTADEFVQAVRRMPAAEAGLAGIILQSEKRLSDTFGGRSMIRAVGNYVRDPDGDEVYEYHGDPCDRLIQRSFSQQVMEGLRHDQVARKRMKYNSVLEEFYPIVTAVADAEPICFPPGDYSCHAGALNRDGVSPYYHRGPTMPPGEVEIRMILMHYDMPRRGM